MKKSVFFYKELTPAEVGNTGTHEIYVRLPNNFDHEAFFGNKATENGSVLEINFTAFDTTDSNYNSVNLRFVYFINSNQEKRIPGLGEIFKLHNVQEGDIVCIESREDNSQTSFYIHFYKKGSITIYPSSVFFMRIGEEMLTNPKSIFSSLPLQQIYYGAPGTGKSFEINLLTKDKEVIRTTFHPDSDYSTFVGAYKPTSIEIPVRDVTGKVIVENGKQVTENRIVYEFVEQAFLQAYTKAWKAYAETAAGESAKEQFLVIEEINRGNCAQIFGDLFQLLDRNRYGFSDYPITADKDMKKQLSKAFKDLTIADADRINKIYDKDIISQVLNGEVLLLPDNLYIWATMNTSDQSLFPIDSAFKRRWDWKYMPICEGKENGVSLNWKIKTKTNTYDWWQFVEKINAEINEQTKSEDKKLGYFFCKADSGVITAETFVSKVVFYLWNDVFKDQSLASDIFQDGEEELTFAKFYDVDANGKAVVREDKVELFLQNLGVEIVTSNKEDGLIEIDELDENNVPDNTRNTLKAIEFPDGTIIDSTSGAFDAYIRAIEKIGIAKVASVSDRLKYRRHDRPLISKEKYDEFEGTGYSYIMKGDYYFLKGAKTYTYVRILEDLNDLLQLGITIRN